jgi:ATP-dependent Clp protease protease subunit
MSDEDNKEPKLSGRSGFLDEKLFKSRAITIFGEINDNVARSVTERLRR